ncbi:MAG: hypothetical protein J6X43_06220, partial [Bacteroidales bacterium]|nr:hypothetical protein [Bacteroidales bacterium]
SSILVSNFSTLVSSLVSIEVSTLSFHCFGLRFFNQNICEVVADEEINDAFHIDKISLSYAKSLYKDIIVGEKITLKPSLASLVGRRNVIEIRQILIEKVRDLVYNELYEKYKKIAAEFDTGNQLLNQKKQILVLAALL